MIKNHDDKHAKSMGVRSDLLASGKGANLKQAIPYFFMGFFVTFMAFLCYDLFSAIGEWAAVNFR